MRKITVATLGLAMLAAPAFAHHPFESEFDAKAPVTLKGKVTQVEWQNPHVVFKLEAPDAQGKMKTWDLEAGGPDEMSKMGWTDKMLKSGDQITVHGYRAKADTSSVIAARTIELPGGKMMTTAGNDGGPKA
jgi:hypothetical protein